MVVSYSIFFFKQTYGCSKSTESEILSLSSKLMRRNKNKYGYNFPFQVLPFNQPKNIPIGSTLIEYGSMKLKIERVFIFVTPPLCQKKMRFDLTLGSNIGRLPRLPCVPPPASHPHKPESHQKSHRKALFIYSITISLVNTAKVITVEMYYCC